MLFPAPNPREATLAVQGRQHRKHKPLVSEFLHVVNMPKDAPLPPNSKVLSLNERGIGAEIDCLHNFQTHHTIGVFRDHLQFLEEAEKVDHPMDVIKATHPITVEAMNFLSNTDERIASLHRQKEILRVKILIKQLQKQEEELHSFLDHSVEAVVANKKILVFRQLLENHGFDDLEVCEFLTQGVPIVGIHNHPQAFEKKIKAAEISEEDLRSSAIWRRKALIKRKPQTDDPAFAKHLEETAEEEVAMKFLEGPFTEEEVTARLETQHWAVMRRFVIQQGEKLRPIDDGAEAQINAGYTSTIRLDLQDADYIAALALKLGSYEQVEWKGKCLDLTKAYKQLPLKPDHRALAVVLFRGTDNKSLFYLPNSLMFGSSAAVYAFNRISRAIWFLINKVLKIPCAVYYDDFPLFAPEGVAEEVDRQVSEFLSLLGWDHARTGVKGKPFSSTFDVLGMTLNLSKLKDSQQITLQNKEGRIRKLVEKIEAIHDRGSMTLTEAQEIHGLLNFATGFFSGRQLRHSCFRIFGLVGDESRRVDLAKWAKKVVSLLESTGPRVLKLTDPGEPVLIFTDGSWEKGEGLVGAFLYDPRTRQSIVLADRIPDSLIAHWKKEVGDQLICEIELFIMVACRIEWKHLLVNRRSIWFVDNEAARRGLLKGTSHSREMDRMIQIFYELDAEFPTFWWLERVPSKSNPADLPSRKLAHVLAQQVGGTIVEGLDCRSELANLLDNRDG